MKEKNKIKPRKRRAKEPDELRQLLDSVGGYAICVLDKNGFIRSWNAGARKLTGYKKFEAIGRHYSILFTGEDIKNRVPQRILEFAAGKGVHHSEGIRKRKNGTKYWADVTINAIRDNKKRLIGFTKVAHDKTHEHELLKQKDEFIGIAAHELKTPIATLSLNAQLLREHLARTKSKEALTILSDIETQADRFAHLIDDLLTANTVQAGMLTLHKNEFNIGALAKEVIKNLQGFTTQHTIVLVKSLNKDVRADEQRVRQVFINLIENAIKYTEKGRIKVRAEERNGKAYVSVKDIGPGIPKKDHAKIFKSRFRSKTPLDTKAGGLGLGLYICAEIIKAHGEKIWVESKGGKGSMFCFTLPFSNSQKAQERRSPLKPSARLADVANP